MPQEVTTADKDYNLRIDVSIEEMGWGSGWRYMGRTSYYIRPVGPLSVPRTHNGKKDGKRRWEQGVVFPNGVQYSGVLLKDKGLADFISMLMYNQALLHYEMERAVHDADRTRVLLDEHLKGE